MTTQITFTAKSITLAAARSAMDAGVAAVQAMGLPPMSIVVYDGAGQPKGAVRMDGASILSYEVACKKAWTAAVTGFPTAGVHQFIASDAGSLLSMPHVGDFSVVAGGLPIRVGESCVGAVGVSGATAELDLKVAEAVVAALA